MMRALAIAAILAMALAVLYFPSQHSAAEYAELVAQEHLSAKQFWGPARARAMLARALLHDPRRPAAPELAAPTRPPAAAAVAAAMSRAANGLYHNRYMDAVDAVLFLATWRAMALRELGALLAVLALVAVVDGMLERRRKSQMFGWHDPEVFGLCLLLGLFLLCATLLLLVVPVALPPWLLPALALTALPLLRWAVANYHRHS